MSKCIKLGSSGHRKTDRPKLLNDNSVDDSITVRSSSCPDDILKTEPLSPKKSPKGKKIEEEIRDYRTVEKFKKNRSVSSPNLKPDSRYFSFY